MHYYKRNIGDYAKKAGRLSMLEHGAYTLLIDACYDRERFPSKDEAIEWCWARTPDEIAAVEFVLDRFFTLGDGAYTQERIAEELAKYHENAARNSKIATEREAKRTERARSVHKTPPVMHEAPPNQEPLTTNHKKSAIYGYRSVFEVAKRETPKEDKDPALAKLERDAQIPKGIPEGLKDTIAKLTRKVTA